MNSTQAGLGADRRGGLGEVRVGVGQARVALAKGHGWAILPAICVADEIASHTLSMAPLDDPEAQSQLMLAMPRSRGRSPATEAVARTLVPLLRAAAGGGRWPSVQWQAAASPEH